MTAQTLTRFPAHIEHDVDPDPVGNAVFGFWLYIMSDCILFASLFATYAVLSKNDAGGPNGAALFDVSHVFIETLFLLLSSLSYGLAMLSMHEHKAKQVSAWLGLTFALGAVFLGLELSEFSHMLQLGDGPDRSGFLSAFFVLVGTHGLHVFVGLFWMLLMMVQIGVKGLTTPVQSRLLRLSVFWHFLDIVWVGVFSLVYLMGVVQ